MAGENPLPQTKSPGALSNVGGWVIRASPCQAASGMGAAAASEAEAHVTLGWASTPY